VRASQEQDWQPFGDAEFSGAQNVEKELEEREGKKFSSKKNPLEGKENIGWE